MIIINKQSFLENYYNNSDKNLKLYQCKLSEKSIDEINIDTDSLENLELGSSPTVGYYSFSSIISGTDLQISIFPSKSDFSVEQYKTIFIYYEDLETSEIGLAFIIGLSDSEVLRRTNNIINISGFNPKSKISFNQSKDTKRLEERGQGRYRNLFDLSEEDLKTYITLNSWLSYKQLIRSTDAETPGKKSLEHIGTVRINEFGLKIY